MNEDNKQNSKIVFSSVKIKKMKTDNSKTSILFSENNDILHLGNYNLSQIRDCTRDYITLRSLRDAIMKISTPFHIEKNNLSSEQIKCLKYILKGYNVMICGSAGTGKSYLLQYAISCLKKKNLNVFVTASTGIAARNLGIGTSTLHYFVGAGLCNKTLHENLKLLSLKVIKRWKETQVLIIDEISMISPQFFETVEAMARHIRKCDLPFGGLQIICCGDWAQLAPVINNKIIQQQQEYINSFYSPSKSFLSTERKKQKEHLENMVFCFETQAWKKTIQKTVVLTQNYRQSDKEFLHVLEEVRNGKISETSLRLLLSRYRKRPENLPPGMRCTKLFPKLWQVERENQLCLDNLPGECITYKWRIEIIGKFSKDEELKLQQILEKSVPVDEEIKLKVGATVILMVNTDVKGGFCNGLQGIVEGFNENYFPIVRFINNITVTIIPHAWEISRNDIIADINDDNNNEEEEDDEEENYSKTTTSNSSSKKRKRNSEKEDRIVLYQIPLKLAFALTIHKAQSMTIKYLEIDLGQDIFTAGQAYTGLSRCPSLSGLCITNFSPNSIIFNEKANQFYEQYINN